MAMYDKIAASFARQGFTQMMGAHLDAVEYGKVVISCPYRPDLTQQAGYFHGGVQATLGDTAAGYAALTVMPEDAEVLTVEYKVNLMRPAKTDKLVVTGTVVKPGRRLVVSEALVTDAAGTTVFAKLLATMIVLPGASPKS